jgi:PadR family transcriptional regulator PadR
MNRSYSTELEQSIMQAIMGLGDDAYGVTIRNKLEKMGSRVRSFGTIYASLERMEENGFVSSRLGDPTPDRGGRAKRFYKVTAIGQASLREAMEARRRLESSIPAGALPRGA